MEQSQFWNLIDQSRAAAEGDCELHFDRLSLLLAELAPDEILSFHRQLLDRLRQAYTWNFWAAAYVINGGASDDGFEYFRAWLIGRGEATYTAALVDPDTLATLEIDTEMGAECEPLLYAPGDAYRSVTGMVSPIYADLDDNPETPSGEPWTEDDLPRRVPKLFEKYG